jgi:hypothetical protein
MHSSLENKKKGKSNSLLEDSNVMKAEENIPKHALKVNQTAAARARGNHARERKTN